MSVGTRKVWREMVRVLEREFPGRRWQVERGRLWVDGVDLMAAPRRLSGFNRGEKNFVRQMRERLRGAGL